MADPTKTCKSNCGNILLSILLIINIIVSAFALCYAYQNYQVEVIKAGWKENFNTMMNFYKSDNFVEYISRTQPDNIKASAEGLAAELAMMNDNELPGESDNTADQPNTPDPKPAGQHLDPVTLATLKQNGYLQGDEYAPITILEFADVNCGYCKRQVAQSRTIQTLMESYPNINMIYKNMPVLGSYEPAQVMECFGANSSVDAYYAFVEATYGEHDTSLSNLLSIAESLWGDAEEIRNCVNMGTFRDLVNTQMQEGQSFGITGTPASVIINNETGERSLIEGAYPIDRFESAINQLLH